MTEEFVISILDKHVNSEKGAYIRKFEKKFDL
jgi:hypothetical protein